MTIIQDQVKHLKTPIDGFHVRSNTLVLNNVITGINKQWAHWDAFQLWEPVEGKHNRQYIGSIVRNVILTGNTVDSEGTLQGIFAGDGFMDNIVVTDNIIQTGSHHKITLNGVWSGTFTNNQDRAGNLIRVQLDPVRFVGDIYIISFSNPAHDYKECIGYFKDDRRVPFKKTNGTYLANFDLDKFWAEAEYKIPAHGSAERLVPLMRELVLAHGDVMNQQTYKLDDAGRRLLIENEGYREGIYKDLGAVGFPTIGIGHKLTPNEAQTGLIRIGGKYVNVFKENLSKTQVYRLFSQDIAEREVEINKLLVDISLEQHQYNALFDLYFNIGHGAFEKSTVLRQLKKGSFDRVPDSILMWNKAQGKYNAGIVARRERTIIEWDGIKDMPGAEEIGRVKSPLPEDIYTVPSNISTRSSASAGSVETVTPAQHESPWESSTIRNIVYAVITYILGIIVQQGWLPTFVTDAVTPEVISWAITGMMGVFMKGAYDGRIKATKVIKKS